ncbi:hypothetical protein SSA02_15500 [Swaminathania salitolerans]|uniref:Uncharacterized protein n=2 Tax=Swaminathania salitolerans TaxID=182838 RepID=A0A511BPY3_9PROT|nr:hypothetical protein SSA02_15500 [Swaminathania salitolerans]
MLSLASSYAQAISDANQEGTLGDYDLHFGANNQTRGTGSNIQMMQGVITTGGSYDIGGDFDHVVIGADGGLITTRLNDRGQYIPVGSADPASLNDPVTVNAAGSTVSSLSVLAGDTAAVTFYAGNQNGLFVATMGNNLFDASGKSGSWTIATGDGNDTIHAGSGTNNIRAGDGQNLITLSTGTNFVASEGQDTITGVENATDTVTLLGGNSIVTLQSNAAVVDAALTGSQISVGLNSTVFGGTGSTVTFASSTGTIIGAVGDTISAAGDLMVYHGTNQSISVSGALQFISGTGNTSITAGTGTIWGANGLNANLNTTNNLLFTGNQPNSTGDQSINASASAGTLDAWTGAGNNTIIGGSGADMFVFGTQYEGSSGDSYATVTGGSGAANMFGVLNGHEGGDITITDFGSAAGNMFFMYNYKPADADKAIADILATASVSGGNTTIQLDNNMKVTFLGVTDLKSSNFIIS